jgi:hypothetical protein
METLCVSRSGGLLQLADVLADRRLPDAEPRRGLREAAGLGDREEGLELGGVVDHLCHIAPQ